MIQKIFNSQLLKIYLKTPTNIYSNKFRLFKIILFKCLIKKIKRSFACKSWICLSSLFIGKASLTIVPARATTGKCSAMTKRMEEEFLAAFGSARRLGAGSMTTDGCTII